MGGLHGIIDIMVADGLATLGAKASAPVILAKFARPQFQDG